MTSSPITNTSAQTKVLIWSMEHRGWWRSNSCGYTSEIEDAGLYGEDEATEIVKHSGGKKEAIVTLEDAFKRTQFYLRNFRNALNSRYDS